METNETNETLDYAEKVEAPQRRVVHYIGPDKHAKQRGPLTDPNEQTLGHQKREPCYEAMYLVKHPRGLRINERLFRGHVTVCTCVVNQLSMMDSNWIQAERKLYQNTPMIRHYDAR